MDKRKVVLLVDDDKIYLKYLKKKLLEQLGTDLRIEMCSSVEEAKEIVEDELATSGSLPKLALVDWMLENGETTDDLIYEMDLLYPEIPKVIHSAMIDPKTVESIQKKAQIHFFLPKPWDETEKTEELKKLLQ